MLPSYRLGQNGFEIKGSKPSRKQTSSSHPRSSNKTQKDSPKDNGAKNRHHKTNLSGESSKAAQEALAQPLATSTPTIEGGPQVLTTAFAAPATQQTGPHQAGPSASQSATSPALEISNGGQPAAPTPQPRASSQSSHGHGQPQTAPAASQPAIYGGLAQLSPQGGQQSSAQPPLQPGIVYGITIDTNGEHCLVPLSGQQAPGASPAATHTGQAATPSSSAGQRLPASLAGAPGQTAATSNS